MSNNRFSIQALLVVAVTASVLWLNNGAVTPKETTWNDVVIEAEHGSYRLISTKDLWKRYSEKRERNQPIVWQTTDRSIQN